MENVNTIAVNPVEIVGYIITAAYASLMGYWYWKNYKKFLQKVKINPFEEYDEPSTATGLGILGTFLGITCSLLLFDTKDTISSVPGLLAGMRFAFITSIAGMVISFYLKYQQHKAQDDYRKNKSDETAATLGLFMKYIKQRDAAALKRELERNKLLDKQMSNQMHYMRSSYESLGTNLSKAIKQMTDSIVGDGEHSLNSELRNGLAMISESNNKLATGLSKFREKMLKEQQKQFVKAMNVVVENFNENLNEQFGENFQTFNSAVDKLASWQDDYFERLKALSQQQDLFVGRIDAIRDSLDNVRQSVDNIGSSTLNLEEVNKLIKNDYEIIKQGMSEVAESVAAFKDLSPIVEHIGEELSNTAQYLEQNALTQQENMKQIIENEVQDLCNSLKLHNGEAADELNREVLKSINATNESMKNISAKMTTDLNVRVNESLQALGMALAQISEKFVDDYTPLAQKLEDIVLLANALQLRPESDKQLQSQEDKKTL